MGWTDERYCFPGKQVDCCQQGKRTKTDIFIIPPDRAGFSCIWNWRPVFYCIADRLYTRLFIIGQGMDWCPFKWFQISVFIKLQGYLFVNDKHIMHFGIKIRLPFFTVICYLKWTDFGFLQNFAQGKFRNCCHAWMPFFLCDRVNEMS